MISGILKVCSDVFSPASSPRRVLTDEFISSPRARKRVREANQLLCLIGVIFSLVCSAPAQVDRAGLSGTVTDPSGSVLPQTHVTAIHDATGVRRETISSGSGTYDIAELPVGVYTVTFTHDGFRPITFEDVKQTVGQTRTLDAKLPVSGAQERVEVPASSGQLNETSDALGVPIGQVQAKELPLNGRNWAALTALIPGAVDTGGSNQRSIRFAGRGRDDNNWTYDGIDATNVINQPPQPYVRLAIPLDAIQEFRVDSMLTPAEAGVTGGGQLDVTSTSGTNQFHGNVFEYLRNSVFDATEPVPADSALQPLHLNQYGGSLGGPIVRNKTFFFAAYEGYRQHWVFPELGYAPSPAFRALVASTSPALIPILNAYPTKGLTPYTGPAVACPPQAPQCVDDFVSTPLQIVNEDSGMFRIDHHFSDETTAFVRANIDEAVNTQPNGQLLDRQQLTSSPVNAVIELLHIYSPTLLNEVKFGFNRSTADTTDINQTGLPYSFAVSGLTTMNTNEVTTHVGNTFAGIDNMTWIKGRHVLKAGVEIRRVQLNYKNTENGKVTYASPTAFENNQINMVSVNGALPSNGLRKTQYYGYIQDEFKWLRNLTLNLGARYSFFNIFHDALAEPFDFATCGPQGFCGVGASFGRPNYGDIDPRIAFAWAPTKSGHTVIRGGAGIYHEDGQLDDQTLPISNEVYAYSLASSSTATYSYQGEQQLYTTLSTTPGSISPKDDDRRRKDTYVSQWGLSVQQALPANFVGTISYVGSAGTHLLTLSEVNVCQLGSNPCVRPYPAFGQVSWRGNKDSSNYEGLSIAVKRTFTHGFLFSANYMWSHEIDDGSDGSGDPDSLVPENVACPRCERASGIFDVRHVLNANIIYELPFGPGKPYLNQPGIWSKIAGSWDLTSTVLARTGFPVNVLINRSASAVPDGNTADQRPDFVPGVSPTPPGGSSIAEWINPAAFSVPAKGTFGDAPRDAARGPGAWQIDIGAAKHIPLNDRLQLEFRAEFFNIFNHPQYGPPQATYGASGFGSIITGINTSTVNSSTLTPAGTGTPREIQFALRFAF